MKRICAGSMAGAGACARASATMPSAASAANGKQRAVDGRRTDMDRLYPAFRHGGKRPQGEADRIAAERKGACQVAIPRSGGGRAPGIQHALAGCRRVRTVPTFLEWRHELFGGLSGVICPIIIYSRLILFYTLCGDPEFPQQSVACLLSR